MIPSWMIRTVFVIGIFVLLHSALSAAQHRSFQRINRQVHEAGSVDVSETEAKLPLDIVLETLISMCVVLYCFVHMTVKLKNIRPEADYEQRTVESLDFRPSFMVFGQKESLYKLRLMDQKTLPNPSLMDEPTEVEDLDVPPLEE